MKKKETRKRRDFTGSTFDSFLEEHGIRDEVEAVATKRVLAWQLEQEMKRQRKTKQPWRKSFRPADPNSTACWIPGIRRSRSIP